VSVETLLGIALAACAVALVFLAATLLVVAIGMLR
jgi:hypothetical protein